MDTAPIPESPDRRTGNVGIRKVVEQSGDYFQMIRLPNIVCINPSDEITLGHADPEVSRRAMSGVRWRFQNSHAMTLGDC